MKKKKENPLVKITWLDAVADSTWSKISEVSKRTADKCVTIGYLLANNDKCIVVAGTISDDECNNILVIPRGFIKDIKILDKE